MKDCIKMIMESQQMSQQDFAKKLGISPASLSSIFTGRTNPTNNHVQAIHKAFPAISIEWLMFGDGSMLSSNENISQIDNNAPDNIVTDSSKPMSSIPNSAGNNDATDFDSFTPVSTPPSAQPVIKQTEVETKIIKRKINEIRVFYDDGTYESFLPQ